MMNVYISRRWGAVKEGFLTRKQSAAVPAPGPDRQVPGIKSVEKAAGLLGALVRMRGSSRLIDLATQVGMSRSMARGYLVSLTRSGLVSQNADSGRYDLGPEAIQLGFAALARMDVLQLARPLLRELSAAVQETVIVAMWNARGPVVVAKIDGPRSPIYEIRIGSHVSLAPTSTGHVFMAYLPRTLWEPLLTEVYGSGARPVKPLNQRKIKAVVAGVRQSGLSIVDATATLPGFGAISAPVFGHDGSLQAAVTLVGPSEIWDASRDGFNATSLLKMTSGLSRQLGFSGSTSV